MSDCEQNVPGGAVSLVLSPEKMGAATNRLTVPLLPGQPGANDYTDGVVVEKPFSVFVSTIAGSRAVHHQANTLVAPTELPLVMDGAVDIPVVDDGQGEFVPLSSTVHLRSRDLGVGTSR